MSEQLLVTIRGPQQTIDVELPGDVCVSDLLPLVGKIYAFAAELPEYTQEEAGSWSLCTERNIPLVATRTLSDHGILDGEVLLLWEKNPRKTLPLEIEVSTPAFNDVAPGAETGWIGIAWTGRR
jgi:WXG100 protein secretion system (Wss), protein YukD